MVIDPFTSDDAKIVFEIKHKSVTISLFCIGFYYARVLT